jgi:hypothetical protein
MTLAELLLSLQSKGYSTDTVAAQTFALNAVYRRINGMRRWPYLERRDTALTTTAGQSSVNFASIPALMWVDAVRIELGTEYPTLEYKERQELRELNHQDRDRGTPQYWTEAAGELHLWPVPDASYEITLDYITTPPDLVDDDDVPVFDTTYHDVLVWGAVLDLGFRSRDWGAYQYAKHEYQDRLREMIAEYGIRQRQSSSRIVDSGFYNYNG